MRKVTFYTGIALVALTLSVSCSDSVRRSAAMLRAAANAAPADIRTESGQTVGGDGLLLAATPDTVPSIILERE